MQQCTFRHSNRAFALDPDPPHQTLATHAHAHAKVQRESYTFRIFRVIKKKKDIDRYTTCYCDLHFFRDFSQSQMGEGEERQDEKGEGRRIAKTRGLERARMMIVIAQTNEEAKTRGEGRREHRIISTMRYEKAEEKEDDHKKNQSATTLRDTDVEWVQWVQVRMWYRCAKNYLYLTRNSKLKTRNSTLETGEYD